MREKLNENPIAQIGLVAVLLVAAGFLLLSKMGGGGGGSAAPAETMVSASAGAIPGVEVTASEQSVTTAIPTDLPAPPLPRPVAAAYRAGKTVVVLIVHDGGIDDRLATRAVRVLRPRSEVALFVVPVDKIARYAAVTLGVDVNRAPALVVMRPRRISKGTPQASVSYGLQTPQSIVQAVRDAAYAGPTVSYHPE